MSTGVRRFVIVAGLLFIVVASVMSAQGPASVAQADVSDLLTEVRALRAEVNQAAGSSMRMQLLLARLTLQEHRITSVGREVVEVQDKLRAAGRERSDTQTRLRLLEDEVRSGRLGGEDERQVGHQVKHLSARLSEQAAREQQLRGEEGELLTVLAAEQGRWVDFNARLDDLERSLPARSR